MSQRPDHIIVVEGQPLSAESLQVLRDNREVYEYLEAQAYVVLDKDNRVSFDFVGLVSVNDVHVCVFPKYYVHTECPPMQDFTQIIHVLRKVGYSKDIPDASHILYDDANLSEIAFADKLLRDYIDFGLFSKTSSIIQISADGVLDWGRTVSELDPVFSNGYPIYHDVYAAATASEILHIVTEVQKWAIKRCLQKFGAILGYNLDFTDDCIEDITDLGTEDAIIDALRKELNVTYTDREMLLINRLVDYIRSNQDETSQRFLVYGTKYFHQVWEEACSVIFANKVNIYEERMPFANWHSPNGQRVAKDGLYPDIITFLDSKSGRRLFVLDAKYYAIVYKGEKGLSVVNNPGISDVTKQFLYERVLGEMLDIASYNCFLFPSLIPGFFQVFGFVSFSLFEGQVIHNIYLSATQVFAGYLNEDVIGLRALADIASVLGDPRVIPNTTGIKRKTAHQKDATNSPTMIQGSFWPESKNALGGKQV